MILLNYLNLLQMILAKRELDVLLINWRTSNLCFTSGALNELDVKAKSWLNWQIPILTEGEHTNSRIINMNIEK